MYSDHIVDIAELIVSMLIAKAPKDTWNMVNTIGYIVYDDNNIEILVGGEYAPYAPYTNEKWNPPIDIYYKNVKGKKVPRTQTEINKLKSRFTGGQNPNEGWFDLVLKQVMVDLASQFEGAVITNV